MNIEEYEKIINNIDNISYEQFESIINNNMFY